MQKTINNILFSQFISIIYYAAKTAVQKTRRDYNKNNYYVFLVNKSEKSEKNGIMFVKTYVLCSAANKTLVEQSRKQSVSGQFNRHFGFIFMENSQQLKANSQKLYHTIAHELAHGAFTLYHTFSTKDKGITQGGTYNLLDYSTKTPNNLLRKYQWYVIHNPRLSLFGGDEEEVSGVDPIVVESDNLKYFYLFPNEVFLTPSNKAIQIPNIEKGAFSKDGMLLNFITIGNDNKRHKYAAVYSGNNFYGYAEPNKLKEAKLIPSNANEASTVVTENALIELQKYIFIGYSISNKGKTITAYANLTNHDENSEDYNESNLMIEKCQCRYEFPVQEYHTYPGEGISIFKTTSLRDIQGDIFDNEIPATAKKIWCEGEGCPSDEEKKLWLGAGEYYYYGLISFINEEFADESDEVIKEKKEELVEMASYISEMAGDNIRVRFYGGNYSDTRSEADYLRFLKEETIISKKAFTDKFGFVCTSRDVKAIFSTIDLWEGIDSIKYNAESHDFITKGRYNYSFADLKARIIYIESESVFKTAILEYERTGDAQPISTKDGAEQYKAEFGSNSAIYLLYLYADATENTAKAFLAYRFMGRYGYKIMSSIGVENFEKFIYGATTEIIGNVVASKITGEPINYDDLLEDALLSGLKQIIDPPKAISALMECYITTDNATRAGLMDAIASKNDDEVIKWIKIVGAQCIIGAGIDLGFPLISKYLKNKIPFTKYAHNFLKKRLELGSKECANLMWKTLDFDNTLADKCAKHPYYKEQVKALLAKESGAKAIDILIEAGFDITLLSSTQLKRLSDIIEKVGDSELGSLTNLFKGTKDANGMLVYLSGFNSVKNYKKGIQNIIDNKIKFSEIITIKGKEYKLYDFFKEPGDAFDYYHTVIDNKYYFAKLVDTEGIIITIEFLSDITEGTIINWSKGKTNNFLEDKLDLVDIKDKE